MLVFKEIKQTPIIQIADYYHLSLTPKGADLCGTCPLCGGSGFKISEQKNVFKCFSCKAGGDVITFVSLVEGIKLRDAAKRIQEDIAGKNGHESHCKAVGDTQKTDPIPTTRPAPKTSTQAFRSNSPISISLELDPTKTPFAEDTARYFEAGYCSRGLHRGRVAIPIHNAKGELVAYVGKGEDDDKYPKNYTTGIDVYNLHRAQGSKILIVVESVYEVWFLYEQQSKRNAVALLGKEVSPEQTTALRESGAKAIDLRIQDMNIVSALVPHFYVKLGT